MQINGGCHCGNIAYVLTWPIERGAIPVRMCGCGFCTKHGGAWTSHREGDLDVTVRDGSLLSTYRFGTGTADFLVCARCGAVPVVTCSIDDRLYAVVNANTFDGVPPSSFARTATNFDGEDPAGRLERRRRNWIPRVRLSVSPS